MNYGPETKSPDFVAVSSCYFFFVSFEETEKLLSRMSRAEKAEILQWIIQDLSDTFPGIESSPSQNPSRRNRTEDC
ncbi:hypothetical protein GCM10028803_59790 [Larkinella knui]